MTAGVELCCAIGRIYGWLGQSWDLVPGTPLAHETSALVGGL